jgi:putative ubiquitin-RnfH superfamily antitoxin RatB of RatAB toxin-antitoxin module
MADLNPPIHVQICYATLESQILHDVTVPAGATLLEAIIASSVLQQYPEIDLAMAKVGIYGKLKSPDTVLRDHDRVEIYRPLVADPKDSRRIRADKKNNKKPVNKRV